MIFRRMLMKYDRKPLALLLVLVLFAGIATAPCEVRAEGGKTGLNKTALTLTEGETAQLKLKNAPKGKTIRWSSSKKSVATVSKNGMVIAKNAGKATVTATAGKQKYTCTVKVKALVLKHTKGKNASDVAALRKIIKAHLSEYNLISTDLNNKQYHWEKGRLTEITWEPSFDLRNNTKLINIGYDKTVTITGDLPAHLLR